MHENAKCSKPAARGRSETTTWYVQHGFSFNIRVIDKQLGWMVEIDTTIDKLISKITVSNHSLPKSESGHTYVCENHMIVLRSKCM